MKKKVFSIIGLAAIAAVVMFNVNLSSQGDSFSDLALANVEALARSEGGGSNPCFNSVYLASYGDLSVGVTECYTCMTLWAKSASGGSFC